MPIPTLNTDGIDISNTLLKLHALKQQDAVNAATIEARGSDNALSVYKLKQEQREAERKSYDDSAKALGYIAAAEGDPVLMENNYKTVKKVFESEGKPGMPDVSYFYTDGKFDAGKFRAYSTNVSDTINKVRDPKEGSTFTQDIANPNYDSSKPASLSNPPAIKVHMVIRGGKAQRLEGAELEPKLDPYEKERRDEKRLAVAEERLNQQDRHNRKIEEQADKRESRIAKKDSEKENKPKRVAYRVVGNVTNKGAIMYFDENNPKDRKKLEEHGNWYEKIDKAYADPAAETSTGKTATLPRKTVNGKTYEKRSDGWYEVGA